METIFFFNNIQGKVKKWRGQVKVERKIKQKGTKRFYVNVHRKYLGIKIRNFFGNGLKDKYNTRDSVGEESIVWKYTYLL